MIYATADIHGIPIEDPPSDAEVLLVVGDICPDYRPFSAGDRGVALQAAWLDTVWREWLDTRKSDGVQVVGVWGNHDFVGEEPGMIPKLPWRLLQDSEITLETSSGPLRVYGTPWVPGLHRWAFFATARALEARAAAIPTGLDVLMSHGPPFGAGDFIPGGADKQANKYGNIHGISVGDQSLGDAIKDVKPVVTVCGHIHEARGSYHLGDGGPIIENVSAVDEFYEPVLDPWVQIR